MHHCWLSSLRETQSAAGAIVIRVAEKLTNPELRTLKAKAQLLKPMLKVGKDGLSPAFVNAVHDALEHHELVKVKFDEFKEQKKELGPKLADRVAAQVVMQVGHVIVLFRRKLASAKPD